MATPVLNETLSGPKPPVEFRDFDDTEKMRTAIFDGVLKAVGEKYPLQNARYRLHVDDLNYNSNKPYSLADQKKAIIAGDTLSWKLNGTWKLIDQATNQVVDQKKGVIAHVPYATPRGTFIYGGNEYSVANQIRLKPGVYSRQKENGELEAHFNTKIGTGSSFRVYMEPSTGIFRLGVGQSTLKLYPILKSMGVQDKDIEKHWGRELLQNNVEAEDPRAVARAFARLVNEREEAGAQADHEKEAALFGEDEEFDKDYLRRSQYTGDLFMPPPQVWQTVEVKESPVHGKGLFVKKEIDDKELISPAYMELAPGDIRRSASTKWINHSEDPNVELQKEDGVWWLIATRKIYSGEELYLNYEDAHKILDFPLGREGATKEAKLGVLENDRRWSKLWFTGTLRAELGKDSKPWVFVEVHKGLVDSAFDSLKAQGVECERAPGNPHITVLRHAEAQQVYDYFGPTKWKGAVKDGTPIRFSLNRMVSCVPLGWKEMDRVWFIEVSSPDLKKFRSDLGHAALPQHHETQHDMPFHITFAVHRPTTEVKRAYDLLTGARSRIIDEIFEKKAAEQDHGAKISEVFNKMELDPDVTEATLGSRYTHATPDVILRTSQKLLNIHKGNEDVDDRDSLAFQTLHSPEDFFAERVRKDAGQLGKRLLWKATLKGSLKSMPTGVLTPQMDSVLLKSGMGMPLEEANALDMLDQNLRLIRLGEGGLSSTDAVPMESRSVQPSHFGFIDPIKTPESEKAGIDQRVTHRVQRGSDNQFYTPMTNARTGAVEPISARMASKSVVAFPGELARKTEKVRAMVKARQLEWVDRKDVDYELPHPTQMFTAGTNLIPLVAAAKGGRLSMGSRFFVQALPLLHREAPLVQNFAHKDAEGQDVSFDDLYGEKVGAVRAKARGVVTDVTPNGITVKQADGTKQTQDLYHNFPYNRKTFNHNEAVVKIGDTVKPGQLLASSNHTDAKGALALGTNLRTAYMPYAGWNYEDAIVISENAAKKLSSEHMYQQTLDKDDEHTIGRKEYISMYPLTYNKQQLSVIDNEGVIKPGTVVKTGDPLILSLRKASMDALHRGQTQRFVDAAVKWEHSTDGIVTDVEPTKGGGYNVIVKTYAPMKVGDKLAGRMGDKGVISKIVPDAQMVHDAEGKPYDVLLNPLGIITRGNPSQVFETLLGKVARKQGKPYKVPGFSDESLVDFVGKELKKSGLKDTEDLYDPVTGKKIRSVLTGERWFLKLHHTAEAKGAARDVGAYTSEGLPARGGESGSKRIASMEQAALISHGALGVLKDAQVVRGQRNDEFWRAFKLGQTPPSPKVPMVYEKFLAQLQGSGINIKKEGNNTKLLAMTDKDIEKLSRGEITVSQTVENDTQAEIPGGLFDRSVTGGHGGKSWGHIKLVEPIPNPIMEEPIRRLLGVTGVKFRKILAGEEKLGDQTGGAAIQNALKRINVDAALDQAKRTIDEGRGTKRDAAIKTYGYLKTLKDNDISPSDLMMTKVPVLPPMYRPITKFNKMQMTADPNYFYRDLLDANTDLKETTEKLGADLAGQERLKVYDSFKAVTGLGDPTNVKTAEKNAKGLLRHVFGDSPKLGSFQRRVLGSPVDIVGRAVITADPHLNIDQVGLPEDKAWTMYRPFIMRRLVRAGMPAASAALEVVNQSPRAKKALDEEIQARPVLINRAPTLHKYGFTAAWPKLIKDDTMHFPAEICAGMGADFDGDSCVSSTIISLTYPADSGIVLPNRGSCAAEAVTGESEAMPLESSEVVRPLVDRCFADCQIKDFPRVEGSIRVGTSGVIVYDVPPGVEVLSYDALTGEVGYFPVSEFSVHPNCEGYQVTTQRGLSVGLSADHSLYVLDPETCLMKRAKAEESVGSAVPVIKRIERRRTVDQIMLPEDLLTDRKTGGGQKAPHRPVTEIAADFDFGWWLGASISDAWSDYPGYGSVNYAKTEESLISSYIDGCRRLVPTVTWASPKKVRHTNLEMGLDAISTKLTFSSTALSKLVLTWFGRGAANKHMPDFVASLPQECLWGLLTGLLDGDGSVSLNKSAQRKKIGFSCSYTTTSDRLKDQLVFLGKLLGIRVGVSRSHGTAWLLTLSTVDVYKYRENFIFKTEAKRRIFAEMPIPTKDDLDLVPFPPLLAPFMTASLRKRNLCASDVSAFKKGKLLSRICAKTWFSYLEEDQVKHEQMDLWKLILDTDAIIWDRVKTLEKLPTQVMYDLTVPGTAVFAANAGWVIYDSLNYHVPVTDEAVRDAVEKMLPSSNLKSTRNFQVHYVPRNEYLYGLYLASSSKNEKKSPRIFRSRADVLAAYKRGEIGLGDPVSVK